MDSGELKKTLEWIQRDIGQLQDKVENFNKTHITKDHLSIVLEPIKKVVYGTLGLILSAVIIAIINSILK